MNNIYQVRLDDLVNYRLDLFNFGHRQATFHQGKEQYEKEFGIGHVLVWLRICIGKGYLY